MFGKSSPFRTLTVLGQIGALLVSLHLGFARAAPGKTGVRSSSHLRMSTDPTIQRVREQILSSAGGGSPSRPRYFMCLFGYQADPNNPEYAHTFASYVRVTGQDASSMQWLSISWLPATFGRDLKVDVFGSEVPGRNYSLEETIAFTHRTGSRVATWGPYEITPQLYRAASQRVAALESGSFRYVPNDHGTRGSDQVVNCMHAVSDLDGHFEEYGGLFNSGLGIWGIRGTKHVLEYYRSRGTEWMLSPVDPDEFDHGQVWSPSQQQRRRQFTLR